MDFVFFSPFQWAQNWLAVHQTAMLGVICFSIVFCVGAFFYSYNARKSLGKLGKAFNKIETILTKSGGHWFYFQEKSYQGAGDTGLSDFLNHTGNITTTQHLIHCFETSSAHCLQKALETWHKNRTPFQVSLLICETDRTVRCSGASCDGRSNELLMWFSDVTDYVADLGRQQTALDGAAETISLQKAWLNSIPRPFWIRTKEGQLIDCNDYYADVFQLTRAEVLARNLCVWKSDGPDKRLASFDTNMERIYELRRHLIVGGERRYYSLYENPIPQGLWAGFGADLTDAEKASHVLEHHILAYREVLEQLSAGISVYGADGRLRFFNHAYSRLFNFDEKWLSTSPTLAEVLDDAMRRRMLSEQGDYPAFKKRQMLLVNSLMHSVQELEHLPDERTLRRVSAPHPMGGIFFIFEDVTNNLTLERQYNTQLAVHRASLDNLYEGVAVFGGDNRLRLFNPAFARIWNFPLEKVVVGSHISELVDLIRPFFDHEDWANQKNKIISKVTDRIPKKRRLIRKDEVVLDFSYVPLPDGSHLMSYVDVSDSCRIERALSERNEALETTEKLKTGFLSSVSRDLKNPINTILGHAEILSEEYAGPLTQKQVGYCQNIVQSGQQLLSLVNDILDLAAIDAGQVQLTFSKIDLKVLFDGCWELVRSQADAKNIQFDVDHSKNTFPIQGDENRLRQVVMNLLKNAVHYTPEGGRITLIVETREKETLITLIDTGIGIARKDLRRIFDRFERTDSATTLAPGSGLGLALVKSLIEMHGGKVKIRSKPQVGTAITCHLPTEPIIKEAKAPLSLTDAA